jgi:hypothetical protein
MIICFYVKQFAVANSVPVTFGKYAPNLIRPVNINRFVKESDVQQCAMADTVVGVSVTFNQTVIAFAVARFRIFSTGNFEAHNGAKVLPNQLISSNQLFCPLNFPFVILDFLPHLEGRIYEQVRD